MKHLLFPFALICAAPTIQAQTITLADLENQFIQNNSQLLASKFNIDKAQAEIIQEKLWPNPTLSISEVNLWKTYNIEQQPNLFGNYGKNQQISVELEQLIETAGKRKKRVALKQLEQQSAAFDYEEILRELRKDLRLAFHQLNRIQQEETQLKEMVVLYSQMSEQYQRQAQLKNIATADLYRIQTELMGLQKEQIELENERFEALNNLRILTHNPNLEVSQIQFQEIQSTQSQKLPINLLEIAQKQNVGLKRQENEEAKAQQVLALEKAQKTPDLRVQMNYDRGGNIMRDFIGVGISFDLPVFNTNKGNIKAAEIGIQQQQFNKQTLENNLTQSIHQLQNQLIRIEQMLENWPNAQRENQKQMVENYKKHLQNKQVTLLEFIDFTQAYREANQAYLQLQQTYQNTFEELQYIVGQDF
ncbi:TolC family protein [Faecalibacter sp. LW9]|uniref:TolC family protein n=1 Tax=Faecalibacter sp. LW9 TaxID=3103144 RepID=UPI002B002896|nr:TolC family protein [Faecalibacter sp. LW9]